LSAIGEERREHGFAGLIEKAFLLPAPRGRRCLVAVVLVIAIAVEVAIEVEVVTTTVRVKAVRVKAVVLVS